MMSAPDFLPFAEINSITPFWFTAVVDVPDEFGTAIALVVSACAVNVNVSALATRVNTTIAMLRQTAVIRVIDTPPFVVAK